MLVQIRGAGDIATGVALRLFRSGMNVIMVDLPVPTSIRRTVCFSEAIRLGSYTVEGVEGVRAENPGEVILAIVPAINTKIQSNTILPSVESGKNGRSVIPNILNI